MKAKRFADNAQDFPHSSQCRHRRGIDAFRDPAARGDAWIDRACRDLGYLKQLNLFGDVFERVRSDYVEKPDDRSSSNPRSAACWADSIRIPAIWMQDLQGHAGPDPRRIRRARHRSHDGRRPDQGGVADRRHAGFQGRHPGQRHHHHARRRAGPGAHAQPGGREDARAGQHQDPAEGHPQGHGQSDRRDAGARQYPRPLGARRRRRRRYRLYPHHHLQRADHRRAEEGDQQSTPSSATS